MIDPADAQSLSSSDMAGTSYTGSISGDAGLSFSGNSSVSELLKGGNIYSIGGTVGIGVGPTIFNGMFGISKTKVYKNK
ncbi:hypothetical protein [Dysgonomonas macrotermitis]|uniref:Uncharacterized protein n=1 Tax=Dysgonomonas macrotermitis TaxID=1346286 RepID=A0A1M4YEE7_9BACT|nr:hypothetical protein [Dysgonomonas macrotermitis]SHF03852.1 hypothetical protein SAMN05444362_103142 [Dysgonomonas macrotermitis]